MSDTTTLYEIFISYARNDNQPIPETYPHGWGTGLRDHILADHRRSSTEPVWNFFDIEEIKDMDDWRHHLLGGLRSSKILHSGGDGLEFARDFQQETSSR